MSWRAIASSRIRRRRLALALNPLALVALLGLVATIGLFEPHVLALVGVMLGFNSWLFEERLLEHAAATQQHGLLARVVYAVIGASWLWATLSA